MKRARTFPVLGRLMQEAEKATSRKKGASYSLTTHLQAVLSPSFAGVQGGNSTAGRAQCIPARCKRKSEAQPRAAWPWQARTPAQTSDAFPAVSAALWLYAATCYWMLDVTSIKAGITTSEGGQAASLCCQTGIHSANKLCAQSLLAPPGKHMSYHKARTKTSSKHRTGGLFPSPALISAGPGPLAILQLLARAPSHCSQERLYSLMKMAK